MIAWKFSGLQVDKLEVCRSVSRLGLGVGLGFGFRSLKVGDYY